jgi:hypothetical protein
MAPTYDPTSLLKGLSRKTTHFPRVFEDIKVGPSINVLDFVGTWLQFSIYEDGRGVVGRSEGHGQNE